jgi:hypothetical protein
MRERQAASDWASARRRRWSASRIAAAAALHLLVLTSLRLAVDRVELPRHGADRVTTLVMVALHAAPPPPMHALPLPRPPAPSPVHASPRALRDTAAPARPGEQATQAIMRPTPPTDAAGTRSAAAAPASAPPSDLSFLDNADTRQAIRDAARGGATPASRGNAIKRADETAGERLARNIDAAHKGDCLKGDYAGGGMGLLSLPFLLAAEALGHCAHKL